MRQQDVQELQARALAVGEVCDELLDAFAPLWEALEYGLASKGGEAGWGGAQELSPGAANAGQALRIGNSNRVFGSTSDK